MMPTLQHFGVGSIPWSPLAGGLLCRPYSDKPETARAEAFAKYANVTPAMKATIAKVQEIADKRGVSMAQVGLAWSLSKDFVSAPIVGTTKIDQLRDMVEGVGLELSKEEVQGIDELYEVTKVQGHS